MNMKNLVAAFTCSFGMICSAQATLIGFEDVTSGNCASLGAGTVSSNGYDFVGNPADSNMFGCAAGVVGNNTSNGLINANSLSILTMTKSGGGAFSLDSFFAGTRFISQGYGEATGIDVLGTLSGGGTVQATFGFVNENFDQFNLTTSFADLVSVTFTSLPGTGMVEFIIDDIVVNERSSVPEPGTITLLGLALVGLGLSRRKAA